MEVAEVVAEVAPEVLVATRASNEENVGVTEVDILAVAVVVVGGLDLGVPADPCCSVREDKSSVKIVPIITARGR